MKNQMTYAVALNAAVACEALPQEVREKLAALLAQQEKKASAEKKPTKAQRIRPACRVRVCQGYEQSEGIRCSAYHARLYR